MGMFSELLEGIDIKAASPDRLIWCEIADGKHVNLYFEEGAYSRYTEASLAPQLGGLAENVWSGQRSASRMALRDALGDTGVIDSGGRGSQNREFKERRGRITAEGRSRSSFVGVKNTGMVSWEFSIAPGTLSKLKDDQFLFEVWTSIEALMSDYRLKLTALRHETYGTTAVEKYYRAALEKISR